MSEQRPLGALHVAAVVVGAIIGVGIFFTPASLARALPGPGWVLGVWALAGVVSLAGALVYAELGGRYPAAGGIYVFLREGFGPRVGPLLAFMYGSLQLLVVQPGAMAVIAVVLVDHVAFLTGPLGPFGTPVAAVAAILLFTGANLLGLRTGGRIQVAAAALKLSALGLLLVLGLFYGDSSRTVAPRSVIPEGGPFSWLLAGLIPALFSFGGAYHGTYIAGSVRDPERSVPRGIAGGIVVVLVAYLLVNVAFLGLLGHDGLAASKSPAAEATALALGPLAGKVLAVVIVVSAAGILNTVCLGFPFVVYAMAKDGLFFRAAGKLDERTGRPALAVATQGILASIAVVVGASRVDVLLTGIAFADAFFQAAVAIVHYRARKTPPSPGTLRAPLVATVVFFLLSVGIAIGSLVERPIESAYGALVFVLAVAIWFARRGRR
jgi:basic amino acid/polyamine antiporter, APA family